MSAQRAMHPLCCIVLDRPGVAGDQSPDLPTNAPGGGGGPPRTNGDGVGVAGFLYKWTNYGRGWRSRWFSLRHGVLSYSKIRPRDGLSPPENGGTRVIGDASERISSRAGGLREAPAKPVDVVYLKVSSFRESKSDDRRFYIFSRTKTLHLRTDSKKDRVAWIEALVLASSVYSLRTLSERISFIPNDITFSTERLRDRMLVEGLREDVIKDCEQIMLSEFSEYHRRLKIHYEKCLNFLGTVQQQLEEVNIKNEAASCEGHLQLMKTEYSCSGHGKYSEYSTTESSDDVEKQETDDISDEEESYFFDTKESFNDVSDSCAFNIRVANHETTTSKRESKTGDVEIMYTEEELHCQHMFPHIERRKNLPAPLEKEKSISLWSLIKDNVGKDLTRVCLPVYFNEPLSSLQKCFEELEYSYLLDQAYEFGKRGNSLMRILKVAAFAVSGYASSIGRSCKPFNPLLGETYEADFPEKGIRFISEKVSHHPMLIACHCEGKGWKFWGDSNLTSKFWGQSIQLDPVGVLTLEFDDGEIFQWSKVTTTIYNLIFGRLYCEHHGTMNIRGNRQFSCQLKFKEKSLFDRNPRQVQGYVEDVTGAKVASLLGKWDDLMYRNKGDDVPNKTCNITQNMCLLWERSKPPANPTRYNLTSFAITLNELTSELQEKLPPTDSRLRPDQRHLENGEYEKANAEKLRLEKRQRMSRKLQENGWKPRWFQQEGEDGTYHYVGGYWEAREQKKWDGFELKKQSSCSMQLINKTDHFVAFKVKTTNPKKYCVRPNTGIVLPRSTCDVTVTMQAQKEAPPDMQCKDKFLLQSVIAEHGATTKDITSEMFNKEPGKVVDEFKLRVVYVPAGPPSPVHEESEEGSSPRSSTFENGTQSLQTLDSVSRSNEPSKEKSPEALAMISKLTEEKNSAIQLNQKLRQELDLLRKERGMHHGGFSVTFVVLVGLLGALIGYIIKKS
ncbi:unnamed protein product [Musa hybrid cultivar]